MHIIYCLVYAICGKLTKLSDNFKYLGGKTVIIKRIAAVVLTIAMAAASLTGCGKNYEKAITVNGVDVAPGMYLYAQYMAYLEAETMVETGADVLSATIEETPAKDWIHTKTIENLKKYIWVENTAREMNLQLTVEDQEYIDYQSEYYWPMAESIMRDNGIGEETYKKFITNEYVSEYVVFQTLYGEGGEREPSDEAVAEYMDGKYARIKGFELSKVKPGTEEFISAQALADLKIVAVSAVEQLNKGADFNTVMVESLKAAAEINGDTAEYKAEDAAKYTVERYLTKDDVASFEEMLTANAFRIGVDGEWVYNEVEKDIIVYQRVKNLKDQTEVDYYKLSLTHEMCADEYAAYIAEQTADWAVSEDAAAVKYYAVENIK